MLGEAGWGTRGGKAGGVGPGRLQSADLGGEMEEALLEEAAESGREDGTCWLICVIFQRL